MSASERRPVARCDHLCGHILVLLQQGVSCYCGYLLQLLVLWWLHVQRAVWSGRDSGESADVSHYLMQAIQAGSSYERHSSLTLYSLNGPRGAFAAWVGITECDRIGVCFCCVLAFDVGMRAECYYKSNGLIVKQWRLVLGEEGANGLNLKSLIC